MGRELFRKTEKSHYNAKLRANLCFEDHENKTQHYNSFLKNNLAIQGTKHIHGDCSFNSISYINMT